MTEVINHIPLEYLNTRKETVLSKLLITKGDWVKIPGFTSAIGDPLYMSVRYGKNIYRDERLTPDDNRYMNLDIAVLQNGELEPVAMRDYCINTNGAWGIEAFRTTLYAHNSAHTAADNKWWGSNCSIEVSNCTFGIDETPLYQRRGLGMLMTAVSARVLQHKGVKVINFVAFTDLGNLLWNNFGVDHDTNSIKVDGLVAHSTIAATLSQLETPCTSEMLYEKDEGY